MTNKLQKYSPFLISFFLLLIIMFLVIPLIQDGHICLFGDKDITLHIFCEVLAGGIVFLIIEFLFRVYLDKQKEKNAAFLKKYLKNKVWNKFFQIGVLI